MQDEPFFDENGNQIIDAASQLTVVKTDGEIIQPPESTQLTPQERRTNYVSEAVAAAYMKVGSLVLTDEEFNRITAKFPDSFVEILPHNGQIYIPHIHISNRLTSVFKFQWDCIRTREWIVNQEMFAEYVLIIRGVAKGDSIGAAKMQDRNKNMSYDDVLESTRGIALRRIAGKFLCCGNQVWDGDYAEDWKNKWAYKDNKGLWKKAKEPVRPVAQPPVAQEQQISAFSQEQVNALLKTVTAAALNGYRALEGKWRELNTDEKRAIQRYMPDLKLLAKKEDDNKANKEPVRM